MRNKLKAIEITIFSAVSFVFLNSVYTFILNSRSPERAQDRSAALATSPQKPEAARKLAESPPDPSAGRFAQYETKCLPQGEIFETDAAKVRILGPFCGAPVLKTMPHAALAPVESRIENTSSRYIATVFTHQDEGHFSTDFIPLEPGQNRIKLEFQYRGGKVHPGELLINRK